MRVVDFHRVGEGELRGRRPSNSRLVLYSDVLIRRPPCSAFSSAGRCEALASLCGAWRGLPSGPGVRVSLRLKRSCVIRGKKLPESPTKTTNRCGLPMQVHLPPFFQKKKEEEVPGSYTYPPTYTALKPRRRRVQVPRCAPSCALWPLCIT